MSKLIAVVVWVWVAILALAAATALIRVRNTPASNACVNNLRQLDGAKQLWALENRKTTNDTPTVSALAPFLNRTLVCPQGGTYTPGRVNQPPTCSLGGPSHSQAQ